MARRKDVMTTGEVAELCNVAPRTVSKWFDSGKLKGYRIPGSKDRRIPLNALIQFMKQHEIPMDGLKSGRTRVLIVEGDPAFAAALEQELSHGAGYEVRRVDSGFAAGIECERFRPHAMLLDVDLADVDPQRMLGHVQASDELQGTQIITLSARLTDGQAKQLGRFGFSACLRKPVTARQVVETVEQAVSLIY